VPNAGIPLLYLVSGKALEPQKGQRPYQAIFDSIRSGSGPVAITSIEGAGFLDYQDFPFTHPIFSFLLPGLKDVEKNENPIAGTANIIGNYASFLLERAGQEKEQETIIPPRQAINGSFHFESKGLPAFHL
jgi:hypothetical protein